MDTFLSLDDNVKNDYENADERTRQKQEFIDKLDKIKAMGMNAVAVQVRPKGDAFYESGLNPWSEVLTGTQGQKKQKRAQAQVCNTHEIYT